MRIQFTIASPNLIDPNIRGWPLSPIFFRCREPVLFRQYRVKIMLDEKLVSVHSEIGQLARDQGDRLDSLDRHGLIGLGYPRAALFCFSAGLSGRYRAIMWQTNARILSKGKR